MLHPLLSIAVTSYLDDPKHRPHFIKLFLKTNKQIDLKSRYSMRREAFSVAYQLDTASGKGFAKIIWQIVFVLVALVMKKKIR